jgi:hypothetical protein
VRFCSSLIGDYTVRAEQTGFQTFQTSGVRLDLNEVYDSAVKSEVGTLAQVVTVEANPVQVPQTDMQVGRHRDGAADRRHAVERPQMDGLGTASAWCRQRLRPFWTGRKRPLKLMNQFVPTAPELVG